MFNNIEEKLRKTGIEIIGDVPWGTHFCQFYQTKEDLIDILVPYFKVGLKNNEFCIWITSEPLSEEGAKEAMRKVVPDFDKYLKKEQIEIVPHTECYFKNGVFNLQNILNGWIDKLNQAIAKGYDGMRVTGDAAWLKEMEWRDFADYEEKVNNAIDKYRMIAICTYPLDKCGAYEVIDVVGNHGFALIKREGKWEFIESFERKQIGEKLLESEERYRAVVQTANDAIVTVDRNGKIIFWNGAAENIFGYSADEVLGKSRTVIISERLRTTYEKEMLRLTSMEEPQLSKKTIEVVGLRKDGSEFPLELSLATWRTKKRVFFTSIIRDITERKQAEEQLKSSSEQLRALSAHLQSIREEERILISREIHDELGQLLTGLKIDLSWLVRRLPKEKKSLIKKTSSMLEMINTTIGTVQRVATELRPPVLDDLGLTAAVEWQAQDFQNRTGIKCKFNSSLNDIALDRERSTAVFRIFQETLANVARYANATRVNISLEDDFDNLILIVEDNGRGITGSEISSPKSLGLLGMRERALVFGGEVKIFGAPGKGTTVILKIPICKEKSKEVKAEK